MELNEIKYVLEAALLAAGRPLSLERLGELFGRRGAPDRDGLRAALAALSEDYAERGIEIKEVASGYRIQVRSRMNDWLTPLWEERAPRYSRALLETLALIAYRQPITRGEIEEVRGVAVTTNIVRTLLERNWVRVVGHRHDPGRPAMYGTTREFHDYYGLKKLEDLPPLSEIADLVDISPELGLPEATPQVDLVEALGDAEIEGEQAAEESDAEDDVEEAAVPSEDNVVLMTRTESSA
ncbi:MAG: SMC-Scp complex subunit ScpB [Gammaproteobacteria bacterium]|nr:SMC-Scp complex subunit ScpB [Gammaproteobacteria bacterium]